MELTIEYLPVDSLTPYENNTRKHSETDVAQIRESIETDGFNDPIGIWGKDNLIVEGHGRLLAAKALGMETVPCIRLDHMTDAQRRDYAIRHNRTAELSSWDFDRLRKEIETIEMDGFDLDGLGFDLEEAFSTADVTATITEDEAPEPPEEPNAKRGDVWQLGEHRLVCGDSTDPLDIQRLMGDEKGRLLFTSPPYSDMREYEGGKDLSVENLAQFIAQYRHYTDYQCVNLGIQRRNNEIVQYWDEYIRIARESGYKLLAWNVWDKGQCGSIGNQSAFIPIRHEWVFVFGTEVFDINRTWEKKENSIMEVNNHCSIRDKDGTTHKHASGRTNLPYKQMESVTAVMAVKDNPTRALHPATFPVAFPSEYIKAMTNRGDIVIEPFGGSGTTLIACEQLGRKCFIMELEPKYVDVIIQRWEDFTGRKAVLLNG